MDTIEENPFAESQETLVRESWVTDDIASERVVSYCRRKLNEKKFMLNHPPPAGWSEMTLITLRGEITHWERLFGQAVYN